MGGVVFDTLKCGVFDVLEKLKNLRVLYHEFANNPIIVIFLVNPFPLICGVSPNSLWLMNFDILKLMY